MSAPWMELRCTVDRADVSYVSHVLFELGASGVQEDYLEGQAPPPRQPWDEGPRPPEPSHKVLIAWFEEPDQTAISERLGLEPNTLTWAPVVMRDWENEWRDNFQPIQLTPELTLAPPWNAPPGSLIIEPGLGFGTGQHESTRGALKLMAPVLATLETCLDVGCGSGVLALYAAREGVRSAGFDIDPDAVENAKHNAELNGLDVAFSTVLLDQTAGTYDLVAANLHAELIIRLANDLTRVTARFLVLAGILADREHLVLNELSPAFDVDARLPDGEWVALRLRRK